MTQSQKNKGLTPKQKAFCEEYLIDLNGTQAAIRAGYSKKGAKQQASMLLTNPNVSNYIKELMESKRAERIASADEVLEFLTLGMRGEIKDQFDLDPTFQDRTRCAELLGKRHTLFTEKKEMQGSVNTTIRVELEDD